MSKNESFGQKNKKKLENHDVSIIKNRDNFEIKLATIRKLQFFQKFLRNFDIFRYRLKIKVKLNFDFL